MYSFTLCKDSRFPFHGLSNLSEFSAGLQQTLSEEPLPSAVHGRVFLHDKAALCTYLAPPQDHNWCCWAGTGRAEPSCLDTAHLGERIKQQLVRMSWRSRPVSGAASPPSLKSNLALLFCQKQHTFYEGSAGARRSVWRVGGGYFRAMATTSLDTDIGHLRAAAV